MPFHDIYTDPPWLLKNQMPVYPPHSNSTMSLGLLPPAFQKDSNVSPARPRVPRSQSLADRCVSFTCRDANSQLEVFPQDRHVTSAFANFANCLPAYTVCVFESLPVRTLLQKWAPASCASVNGIALENSSGDIEVRVPFIDKDNYAFRVWPQSHSAAINRDDGIIVVWGPSVPYALQMYLEIVYRLIYNPLHYITTEYTTYGLPYLESDKMPPLLDLGVQSLSDYRQGSRPLNALPEISEYVQQHSLYETFYHDCMDLWIQDQKIVSGPSPLGVFALLDNSPLGSSYWDSSALSPSEPQQLTVCLADISPPPAGLVSPDTSSSVPSPLESHLFESHDADVAEFGAPGLLTFPEIRDSLSPRTSPEPALRPLFSGLSPANPSTPTESPHSLRPRSTRKPAAQRTPKSKQTPNRKISPLPARARGLPSTTTTPDFAALSLSSPPQTPPASSTESASSPCSSSCTLSPASVGSETTLFDEDFNMLFSSEDHHKGDHDACYHHADAGDDEYLHDDDGSDEEYVEKKPARTSKQSRVVAKSNDSSPSAPAPRKKRVATKSPLDEYSLPKKRRSRLDPKDAIDVFQALKKKPLHERTADEVLILYGMKSFKLKGRKCYPCGFGCKVPETEYKSKIPTGRIVPRTFGRRADSHRHMNSCSIRPDNAPPPKYFFCWLPCKRKDSFERKDAIRRHLTTLHREEYNLNKDKIEAWLTIVDHQMQDAMLKDINRARAALGFLPLPKYEDDKVQTTKKPAPKKATPRKTKSRARARC